MTEQQLLSEIKKLMDAALAAGLIKTLQDATAMQIIYQELQKRLIIT